MTRCLCYLLALAVIAPLQADEGEDRRLQARIAGLIRQLGDRSWQVRQQASTSLAGIGAPAIPQLRKASASEDLEMRWRARQILVQLGALVDPKFLKRVRLLLRITVDERKPPEQRTQAERQLVTHGEKVLPAFFRILVEKDYRMRRHVTELVRKHFRSPLVFPLLLKALEDKDRFVRSGAGRALRTISGQKFASYENRKWRSWWLKNRKTWKPPRKREDRGQGR